MSILTVACRKCVRVCVTRNTESIVDLRAERRNDPASRPLFISSFTQQRQEIEHTVAFLFPERWESSEVDSVSPISLVALALHHALNRSSSSIDPILFDSTTQARLITENRGEHSITTISENNCARVSESLFRAGIAASFRPA